MNDDWIEVAKIFDELKTTCLMVQDNRIIGATFPTVEQAETAIEMVRRQGKIFVQGKTKKSRRVIYYKDPIMEMFA